MSANDVVLYHYNASPYGRRVTSYLALRGLPYSECMQPPILPREDLAALGVSYRRIPLLSIGSDMYLDSRHIISALEARFPEGALGGRSPLHKGIEKLLRSWTTDAGLFQRAAQTIPANSPALQDPKFLKDRQNLTGTSWQKEDLARAQPEAVAELRQAFEFLEKTLLADGRNWILGSDRPSLADVEVAWLFQWLLSMKGFASPNHISAQIYPKVYAYIDRYNQAVESAKSSAPKPQRLKGAEALRQIVASADDTKQEIRVDDNDPLQLRAGQDVEVWPIDSGFNHHDKGRLVGLNQDEVVIEAQTKIGEKTIHIHAPRHTFRIREASSPSQSKL